MLGGEDSGASKSNVGDVCLYDRQKDRLIIVELHLFITSYSNTRYIPVGIVVVPGIHNVYGDKSCGVMSLCEMDYSNPDVGSTNRVGIYIGGYEVNSPQNKFTEVCHVGTEGVTNEEVIGTSTMAYIPSDNFGNAKEAIPNPYDPETYYYDDFSPLAPSPYKIDGSFNSEYSRTSSPSSELNILSNFDGVGNTRIYLELATAQSDWKTASAITNSYHSGYYPAACCCWRFYTEGTKQGDWYLPACGEFGYVIARLKKIQSVLNDLDIEGVRCNKLYDQQNLYWTSSEYNEKKSWITSPINGNVYSFSKGFPYSARAFLRVK